MFWATPSKDKVPVRMNTTISWLRLESPAINADARRVPAEIAWADGARGSAAAGEV